MNATTTPRPNDEPVAADPGADDTDLDVERARVRAQVRNQLFGGPREPVTIGRFEIIERIGSGAMGIVYQARDPELDRVVALKLLHPSTQGHAVDARTKLLLREARAMAKLAHPNVVTIHEVGTFRDQVFIAMEMVRGGTLRDWLQREQPSPAQRVAVLTEAGRGLAAAHAQGLIHRDFKLDNVLIGEDGRPRIGDFGLVKASEPDEAGERDSIPATRRGAVVGTPAYMAPEQLRGESADARSDQFAFCVSVVEALTGVRPFVAGTIPDMLESIEAGLPKATLGVLPPQVARVVSRGTSQAPAMRYPSMDSLLEDLAGAGERKDGSRVRLAMVAMVVVGLAAIAGWLGYSEVQRRSKAELHPATSAMPPAKVFTRTTPIDITRLCVVEARASSETPGHPASLAFDGSRSTAWTEASEGDGTGAWVEAALRPGTWVASVTVGGGWSSFSEKGDVDLWAHNNTFRKMRVSWDGGEAIVAFDRKHDRDARKKVDVRATTKTVRMTALEVDRGRFNDLCLDEVVVMGSCDAQ